MKEEFLATLEETDAETIAIQAPEGLKRRATELATAARNYGVEAIVLGDPCYGSCDPAPVDLRALGIDLIIHLGHTPMNVDQLPTIHLPAESDVDPEPVVKKAAARLGKHVGIITTAQHLSHLPRIQNLLRDLDVEPEIADTGRRDTAPGQVLGCDLGNARVNAPELLYVGTGEFHPIGAHVVTGKRVLAADPNRNEVRDVTDRAQSFVKRRFGSISRAADAQNWGVIVGRKAGQRRIPLAHHALDLLRSDDRDASLIATDLVTPDALLTLGMDAYVNTACPRLSLDDTPRFDRPVLSPQELELVLGLSDEYTFDEFDRHPE